MPLARGLVTAVRTFGSASARSSPLLAPSGQQAALPGWVAPVLSPADAVSGGAASALGQGLSLPDAPALAVIATREAH